MARDANHDVQSSVLQPSGLQSLAFGPVSSITSPQFEQQSDSPQLVAEGSPLKIPCLKQFISFLLPRRI